MADQTTFAIPGLELARIEQLRQEFPILARQVGTSRWSISTTPPAAKSRKRCCG